MKPKAVLAYCREKGIKAFDLRFTDVYGAWKHVTFPVSSLTEASFEEGFGHDIVLDPLSNRTPSHAILVPQGEAYYLDPFTRQPTLVLISSIQDTLMREDSVLDSRHVAVQAMRYLESTSVGDGVAIRASCQFRIERHSDDIARVGGSSHLACGPADPDFQMRGEVADIASEAGLHVERHFSGENASSEMFLRSCSLVECCDDILMLRYILGQNAWRNRDLVNTQKLRLPSQWTIARQGESIFVGSSYRGLSETGVHAIGGILNHANALTAIAVANDSSFQNIPWLKLCSSEQSDSICRVVNASNNPRDRAIEFRGASADSNPYLVFAAVLMAMIDGIQNKMSPGAALEKKIDSVQDRTSFVIGGDANENSVRKFLMDELNGDCDFLYRGDVFSEQLIESLCKQLSE